MFKIETASATIRFLADDPHATWEPRGDGVIVHHSDRDEIFTREHLIEAEKTYRFDIARDREET